MEVHTKYTQLYLSDTSMRRKQHVYCTACTGNEANRTHPVGLGMRLIRINIWIWERDSLIWERPKIFTLQISDLSGKTMLPVIYLLTTFAVVGQATGIN